MSFDLNNLVKELDRLPKMHRVAFAASCCERLLPNYYAFSIMDQWGDFDLLRKALDEVWRWLKGDPLSLEHAVNLADKCYAVAPDTEDFSSLFTSSALDAANAIVETLWCCVDGDARRAAEVGSYAVDTIDMYIQVRDSLDPADPMFEEKIQADPLMLEELEKQAADLKALGAINSLTSDFLDSLRHSSESVGLQPMLRGPVGRNE
jgi:hypothetical protein